MGETIHSFVAVFSLLLAVAGDEVPEVVLKYAENSRRERPVMLQLAKRIKAGEAVIEQLEDPTEPFYGRFTYENILSARTGAIGVLSDLNVKVIQVADESSARVTIGGKEYWLSGVTMDNVADDEVLALDGAFQIGRSRSYTTVLGGTRTLPLLERFNIEPFQEYFTRAHEERTWTEDGLKGVFIEVKRGNAKVIQMDGNSLDIPISDLTEADKEFIRDFAKSRTEHIKAAKAIKTPQDIAAWRARAARADSASLIL